MRMNAGERSAQILSAITDEGQTAREIAGKVGMDPTQARKPIARLCLDGLVFRAKFSSMLVWYFRTEAAAKAFQCPVRIPAVSGFTPPKTTGFARGAHVVRPDHVKVQKCPGFNGLGFAEKSKAQVADGFSSIGIGRYLEETAG